MFNANTIVNILRSGANFIPTNDHREKISELKLATQDQKLQTAFMGVKASLLLVIDNIEKIFHLRVVRDGILARDKETSLLDQGDRVERSRVREYVRGACDSIHKNLFEATLSMSHLNTKIVSSLSEDTIKIAELNAMLSSYKVFYREKIEREHFSEGCTVTPSLNIFFAGANGKGISDQELPFMHRAYLKDALVEYLGLPSDNWAMKKSEYKSSPRYKAVIDSNLRLLHEMSKEYSFESDKIIAYIVMPDNTETLNHLDNFLHDLGKSLGINILLHSQDFLNNLKNEDFFHYHMNSLANRIYSLKRSEPRHSLTELPRFIKQMLILDRIRFSLVNGDASYEDSKNSKYADKVIHSFSLDELREVNSTRQFHELFRSCLTYVQDYDESASLDLPAQDLINPGELAAKVKAIREEVDYRNITTVLGVPNSELNSYLGNTDPELKQFFSKHMDLLREKYNGLELLIYKLYNFAKNPTIPLDEVAELMYILSQSFKEISD